MRMLLKALPFPDVSAAIFCWNQYSTSGLAIFAAISKHLLDPSVYEQDRSGLVSHRTVSGATPPPPAALLLLLQRLMALSVGHISGGLGIAGQTSRSSNSA